MRKQPAVNEVASTRPQCVVVHSQHKSGGTTVEHALQQNPIAWFNISIEQWRRRANCCLYGKLKYNGTGLWWICDGSFDWNWKLMGCDELPRHRLGYPARTEPRILTQGMVLSAAHRMAWRRPHCRWLTVFREPVARLVSSWRYCHHNAQDGLCGTRRANATTNASQMSLTDWAHHWQNWLLRDLLMHPSLAPTAILRANRPLPLKRSMEHEVWEQWKHVLGNTESPLTSSGQANLQDAAALLRGEASSTTAGSAPGGVYDVIGMLDQWEITCAIFDAVVPLRATSWLAATTGDNLMNRNQQLQYSQGHDLVSQAKVNPDIKRLLAADLYLYHDVAVPIFDSQKRLIRAR